LLNPSDYEVGGIAKQSCEGANALENEVPSSKKIKGKNLPYKV